LNIYILLDRSGSMQSLWSEAVGSINGYVSKLKPKTNIHFAVFDSVSYDVVQTVKAKDWIEVNSDTIQPRGGTPLYDACGRIMAEAEKANSKKTVLVVMTDGFENASHEYTQKQIKDRVSEWEKKNWEVVFLGANFDSVESVSSSIGVAATKTINYSAGNFDKGMEVLLRSTAAYASGTAFNFTDRDKTEAQGK